MLTSSARAVFTTYIGVDPNATDRASGTNSTSAEAAFLSTLVSSQTVDFESTGLADGNIAGNTLTSGNLTITANDAVPAQEDLGLNSNSGIGPVGFNVTPGGSNRLAWGENGSDEPATELQFDLAVPVYAFGLYLSGGAQAGSAAGIATLLVGAEMIAIAESNPSLTTGLQYIGFTSDTPFSQVLLRIDPVDGLNSLFYGIDDVTFSEVAATPEPATMALIGIGVLGGAVGYRRRRKDDEVVTEAEAV